MEREKSKIIDTVKRVMPAVVSVIISKRLEDLEREMPRLTSKKQRLLKRIAADAPHVDAHGMVQVGGGSGFIVERNGIVLTNKHVIAEPNTSYTVITSTNQRLDAEVLACDPVNDVAILKVHAAGTLPTVALEPSARLDLGQTVLAFGNALGIFKNTVSVGIVSGLSRSVSAQGEPGAPPQEMRGLIQTDAAINPGNSGGPLVDVFGRAIGINAAVVYGAQSIGFAIPIKAAERDLADLERYGKIRRPLLGLRYLVLTPELQGQLKTPVDFGAFVTREHPADHAVTPGSPAAKAGIREGDIILEWDGKKITQDQSIQDFMEDCAVGDQATLTVLRPKEGRTLSMKVQFAERK